MEKLIFSRIKREVLERGEQLPLILDYKETAEPYPKKGSEIEYNGESIQSIGLSSHYQKKIQFIYKVIHTNLYHLSEGNKLKITDAEIQETYKKYFSWVEKLEAMNFSKEFVRHIYNSARQAIEDEKAEFQKFEDRPLLDKLIHKDKNFVTIKMEVIRLTEIINQLNNKLNDLFQQLKKRKITGVQFDALLDQIDEDYHLIRSKLEHFRDKYKKESERSVQRRRYRLIQSIEKQDLNNPRNIINPRLKYSNITIAKFLVEEYCRWHNKAFIGEIKLAKKGESPQKEKRDERIEMIKAIINYDPDASNRTISKQTGIPLSSVNRWITKYGLR